MNKYLGILLVAVVCFVMLKKHTPEALAGEPNQFGNRGVSTSFGNENVFAQERKVFFNDTYFFGQNGFFDVGDNLRLLNLENAFNRTRRENESLREEVRMLNQRIITLENKVNALTLSGVTPTPSPSEGNDFVDPPFQLDPPIIPSEIDELSVRIKAIWTQSCKRCHTQGRASGGLVLLTADGELAPLSDAQVRSTYTRTVLTPELLAEQGLALMPKGGQRLGVQQRNTISEWANKRLKLQ